VPTVSFMIASLGGYAFHSFATGLGGIVQGTAQASAGDVARGSFNAGQVNYRNVSAGTTSLGSFVWGTTSALMTTMNQHQMDNITRQGEVVTLNKGSVGQTMALMSRLDEPSRRILSNALAITGGKGLVSMVYNEKTGQLQSLSIRGGDGGFAVEYDGSGKLMIEKGGVKHGSIELDNSGGIKGFETSVQVGGLNLEYVKTKAKEIIETAEAYRQVGDAFKTIASKGIKAVDLESLRDNLSKIAESNFADFMEAAKAWGVDERIAEAIVRAVGRRYQHDFRIGNATTLDLRFGLRGGVGVGKRPEQEGDGGFRFGLISLGGGVYLDANLGRRYTDEDIKSMAAYLSRDDRNELVKAFVESLQNKTGQRSSDSQAKRDEKAHTKGTEVSEEAGNSKVYEVAESFGKKAGEMLAYAERLQASLRQDPLNYYAQQKYKEALAAGKSEGEAVRYAMEEVAKLRSNPEALEKWLNEFAKQQGIRSPNVNEGELERISEGGVPKPEDIRKRGQELEREVSEKIAEKRNEISQELNEISLFNPRKAKLFEFQKPDLDLRFNLNDPKLKAYEKQAWEWFKGQPNPIRRALNDFSSVIKEAERWIQESRKKLEEMRIINIPKKEEPHPPPGKSPFQGMP
jgi:hypothetical protein